MPTFPPENAGIHSATVRNGSPLLSPSTSPMQDAVRKSAVPKQESLSYKHEEGHLAPCLISTISKEHRHKKSRI